MDDNCSFLKMPLRFAFLLSLSTFCFLLLSYCLQLGRFPNTISSVSVLMHRFVLKEIKSFGLVNSGSHLSEPANK